MPQQRIHQATSDKLVRLRAAINEVRDVEGLKRLSIPDVIHEVVCTFETQRNSELKDYNNR